MIIYDLIPLFQKKKEIWGIVKSELPLYRVREIEKWLPRIILELRNPTVDSFCSLANNCSGKYYNSFPELSLKIIISDDSYYCVRVRRGKLIEKK